jgi:excisionase family DNA binding protein
MDDRRQSADVHRLRSASSSGSAKSRLMTIEQAAAILNVPENWLRKKVSAREVPHTRLGKHVRFSDEHLDQIVADGEQPVFGAISPYGVSRRARKTG